MDAVGERLRKLREERGMTQSELGRKIGVRQSTISEIERGSNLPSVPVLRRLADLLEVRPGYFLDEVADGDAEKVTA